MLLVGDTKHSYKFTEASDERPTVTELGRLRGWLAGLGPIARKQSLSAIIGFPAREADLLAAVNVALSAAALAAAADELEPGQIPGIYLPPHLSGSKRPASDAPGCAPGNCERNPYRWATAPITFPTAAVAAVAAGGVAAADGAAPGASPEAPSPERDAATQPPLPAAMAAEPVALYTYRAGPEECGPYGIDQLAAWAAQGRFRTHDPHMVQGGRFVDLLVKHCATGEEADLEALLRGRGDI